MRNDFLTSVVAQVNRQSWTACEVGGHLEIRLKLSLSLQSYSSEGGDVCLINRMKRRLSFAAPDEILKVVGH
jgi:hypothetical protein